MKNIVIYKHTSPSGKSYIGQTNNYEKRCRQHINNSGGCPAFSSAIKKYGWGSFIHEILDEGLSLREANILEGLRIEEHQSLSPKGYNLKTGGYNSSPSAETRKRMSESGKERIRTYTDEHREKLSEASKKKSPETWEKIRLGNIGRTCSEEVKLKISKKAVGRVCSDETKLKMTNSRIGKTASNETKLKMANARRDYHARKKIMD